MNCRRCGQEIPDDAKFCPHCGMNLNETINKKATFKEGIMALFNKLFIFEGKSSRSEFNYGLLFLMLISSVFSMVVMGSDINSLSSTDSTQSLYDMLDMFGSKDILDSYNLYNIGVSIVYAIFLSAPVFRRLTDTGFDKKRTTIFTVLFVVSQLLCSNILWCLLSTKVYNSISFVLEILSFINLGILLTCVFRRGAIR